MSRRKSEITLRVHNKSCNSKHNLPQELISITDKIEKLEFVDGSIGKSMWKPRNIKRREEIEIAGFDDLTKSFSVTLYGKTYQQKFFVKVNFPRDESLLESKCLEMGIEVKGREENCYYYNQLKSFYERKIIEAVEDFYR